MADLTIYGSPGCQGCKATVRKAEALGLSFTYIDVSIDLAAAALLVAEGHRSLPVVEAGETVWTGFRPDLLDKVAEAHRTRGGT